jgi:hypothetical protein
MKHFFGIWSACISQELGLDELVLVVDGIPSHVCVLWRENAQNKWALVANAPQLSGWEYAQRIWIEEVFRDLKSHGWQVESCSDFAPQRMERLWILLVVAYV